MGCLFDIGNAKLAPGLARRLAMNERYQAMRAVLDKSLHVLCYEGKFETLPDDVRHRGPWQLLSRGEIEALRTEYRQALARDGFIIVEQSIGAFSPGSS
jgi:hypothetical protein